ncbi:hypothetical protein PORCAN_2115 [Porphyromonas crevioricanis JCM 13913]|nr:hypothetical protein PORCAN_2115 [Porphyromonas crevioricanis JCM 13913]
MSCKTCYPLFFFRPRPRCSRCFILSLSSLTSFSCFSSFLKSEGKQEVEKTQPECYYKQLL